MMQMFIASFWLAISTNVDNFGVGVAYGVKGIRIGGMSNLLIACCNAAGTFLSMKAATASRTFCRPKFAASLAAARS